MTIPVSQREDDDDDETASGKKKTTRTRTDYGTYTDDDDGFGMDAAAAVRRRLPSILRRLLWLGSDDEYEYEHDDDGSSAAAAEAAALVVGIDKPPPSPSPSLLLLLFQGARRLLRDRPIAVFVVALVVVVAAAGFAAATTVLAAGKRPTTGGGSEHHHHGGGGGCRFCDQSPPILRYDEARDIPLPSPSHDDSAVDVDIVTARVVPMTVTYEYELRDGENLFTSPETERIPNLDVDYAVLGVTGFRNLRVIDEDDDDENDGADVSLDEVYVHHFSLLPLNMLGAEVLSRDGGARDDDDDDPYMRLPPGTALRIAADERPHLSVNAHLLSNRNLAPIDGSLSRARKECNECYYSPTRGPDGWCTPENSGTFLCCGDAPVCSSSSEGGAFCGCAVTTTTTTTTTTDDLLGEKKTNAPANDENDHHRDGGTEIGGGSVNEKKRRYNRRNGGDDDDNDRHVESSSSVSSSSSSSGFDPSRHRSHLHHALEGLHRYPGYLRRWSDPEDVDRLERELKRILREVGKQKRASETARRSARDRLEAFHRENPDWKAFASPPETWEDLRRRILDPRAASAILGSRGVRDIAERCREIGGLLSEEGGRRLAEEATTAAADPIDLLDVGRLADWLDEEVPGVYSFPLLSKGFCRKLTRYAAAVAAFENDDNGDDHERPVISRTDFDDLGMGWFTDLVFHLVLRPISSHLYRETDLGGGDLDWRQGFLAAYTGRSGEPTVAKPRRRLVSHTDDSEVTLNLCFGDESFEGGDLRFGGLRGREEEEGSPVFEGGVEYRPVPGRAVVHSGRHLHEVTEVRSGDRYAYIQWARSWGSGRSRVCPCCWLNNRREEEEGNAGAKSSGGGGCRSCIFGRRWN